MTHVFGSQWDKWTDTFLINKNEFLRHCEWAKGLEQFPNLNFVDNQTVKTADDSSAMYFVDHGNPESAPQLASLKQRYPNIRSTRFVDNYLDTFKRIIATATTENVWILSSLCEYDDFDFTWQPGAWEREQIHCFCNEENAWNEKRGDTFYIPVEIFKAQMYDLELLDWFNVINYCTDQKVHRLPCPKVYYETDSLVEEVRKFDFNFPYAVFTNRVHARFDASLCLWTEKDRVVESFSESNSTCIVPRDVKTHLQTQIYDYPYIITPKQGQNVFVDDSLDIVYISNGEPEAEQWYEHLIKVSKREVKRVQNVDGRAEAYKAAANLSSTDWFFAVFAKLEVVESFDWTWQPDYLQEPKHYIFNSQIGRAHV